MSNELPEYLPDILNKNYSQEPIWIDLSRNPVSKVN
jgi:hypothetical protein